MASMLNCVQWYLPSTNQPDCLKLSSVEKFKDTEQCILRQSRPVDHLQLFPKFKAAFGSQIFLIPTSLFQFLIKNYNFWEDQKCSICHKFQSYVSWDMHVFDANFSWVGETLQTVSLCVVGGKQQEEKVKIKRPQLLLLLREHQYNTSC